MTTTTLTKSIATLVSAGTTNTAGSTTRGTVDLRTVFGGILTMKITNGATGPTVQCTGDVLIAHNTGTTPTAASAGSDWKTIFSFGGGTANSEITEISVDIPESVLHAEVEFTGNTGQSVTVEAFISRVASASTT